MKFKILTEEEKQTTYRNEIISMMRTADNDFVPPLSTRSSPFQTDLKGSESLDEGIQSYYNDMANGKIICAFEDGELLGFVTFVENIENKVISADYRPNIYICIVIVKREARGRGLTSQMYKYIFDELYPNCNLFTRTWSTNVAHTKILNKFDFEEFHRITNDRGEGIDSVYFAKIRRD